MCYPLIIDIQSIIIFILKIIKITYGEFKFSLSWINLYPNSILMYEATLSNHGSITPYNQHLSNIFYVHH